MIRTHRPVEARVAQGLQYGAHVDVAEDGRVRALVKAARTGVLHVPAMREVDSSHRAQVTHHRRQVVYDSSPLSDTQWATIS